MSLGKHNGRANFEISYQTEFFQAGYSVVIFSFLFCLDCFLLKDNKFALFAMHANLMPANLIKEIVSFKKCSSGWFGLDIYENLFGSINFLITVTS